MNTPVWPAVGMLVSAHNLCYEVDYKFKRGEKPNQALLCIHAGLMVANAAVFKAIIDKWRDSD